MSTNWGNLIDKILYQRGIAQIELSELLNVDPGTVSRWKRGAEPRVSIQKALKEMLFLDSPMIDPELIKTLPTRVFIAHYDSLTSWHAMSETLAADYHLTVNEALSVPSREWVDPKVMDLLHEIENEPQWKSREAAGFESVHFRSDGSKWKAIGLCFGDRRYLYVNIGFATEDDETGYRILTSDYGPGTDENSLY